MEYSPPLIKSHQALEIQEDIALSAFVEEREKSWDNLQTQVPSGR